MSVLQFREIGATLTEVNEKGRVGLLISQGGRTYFARKWQLTPVIVDVITKAIDHGLVALWYYGITGHYGDRIRIAEITHSSLPFPFQ